MSIVSLVIAPSLAQLAAKKHPVEPTPVVAPAPQQPMPSSKIQNATEPIAMLEANTVHYY